MTRMDAVWRKLWFLAPMTGMTFGVGACLPSGFGSDMLASTIAAIWSDILYTILDFILPQVPV